MVTLINPKLQRTGLIWLIRTPFIITDRENAKTMRGTITTISCLAMLAAATPAMAQLATQVGKHDAWGTYAYDQANSGKVCYVLSVPIKGGMKPDSLDHGNIYFLVSQKPGQNVYYEPQFIASYDFQTDSKVAVVVGDKSFSMFTRGKSAWMENVAEEAALIAAMRGGADMKINAKSGRGNDTSYVFSLKGVTAALNSIQGCK